MIKRNINLIVYNELEKVRRYFTFRFERLINMGLEANVSSDVNIKDNKIIMTIVVEIPHEFYKSTVDYLVRKYKLFSYRRRMYPEETRYEEYYGGEPRLEEGDIADKAINYKKLGVKEVEGSEEIAETLDGVEVDFVEGD